MRPPRPGEHRTIGSNSPMPNHEDTSPAETVPQKQALQPSETSVSIRRTLLASVLLFVALLLLDWFGR